MKKRTFKIIVARITELANEYKELSESLNKDLVMYGAEYNKTLSCTLRKLCLAGIEMRISLYKTMTDQFNISKKPGNPITDIRKQIKASRKLIDVSTGEELPVERRKNKRK